MINSLLSFVLLCQPTNIVNTVDNNKELLEADAKAYMTALVRCGQIYGKSSCVKTFKVKLDPWGQRAYQVTCIAPDSEITVPLRRLD